MLHDSDNSTPQILHKAFILTPNTKQGFATWKDMNSHYVPLLKQLDVNRFLLDLGILPNKQFQQSSKNNMTVQF